MTDISFEGPRCRRWVTINLMPTLTRNRCYASKLADLHPRLFVHGLLQLAVIPPSVVNSLKILIQGSRRLNILPHRIPGLYQRLVLHQSLIGCLIIPIHPDLVAHTTPQLHTIIMPHSKGPPILEILSHRLPKRSSDQRSLSRTHKLL